MTKNLHQKTVKMKIHVETALRNVFEGTKLVFGIFFQESSTCYTNQTFESPLDITIVLSLKRDCDRYVFVK